MKRSISMIRLLSSPRMPCLYALFFDFSLPAVVRGPVDFSHGFHFLMAAACFARSSGVQCLMGSASCLYAAIPAFAGMAGVK
jgi:hypothetical protein